MVSGEVASQTFHERRRAERMEDPEFRAAYLRAMRDLAQMETFFDAEVGVTTSHGTW
jgi:hypothetical protein